MDRKTKVKIQKIFQSCYLLTFFITSIGICGNIELEIPTKLHCWIILSISGFLALGKIIYVERRNWNAKFKI